MSAIVLPHTLSEVLANAGHQMTVEDVAHLRIYLCNTNDLTLEQIEKALTAAKKNFDCAQQQLHLYKAVEGVEVSLLNRILRSSSAAGDAQKSLLQRFPIDEAQARFGAFHDALCEQLVEYRGSIDAFCKLRTVFTSMYPEALVSPRLSRLDLAASPTRHFSKSKSSPALTPRH